jgi:peptidoglycan/LPS O-acetylase OafA/YrhL
MEQNHYNQLDVFRGLAALSVCAVHFNYNSNFFHNYFAMGIFVQLFLA